MRLTWLSSEMHFWMQNPITGLSLQKVASDSDANTLTTGKIGTVLYLAWPLRLTVCNAISEHLDGATPQGRQEPRLAAPFVSVMNYFLR